MPVGALVFFGIIALCLAAYFIPHFIRGKYLNAIKKNSAKLDSFYKKRLVEQEQNIQSLNEQISELQKQQKELDAAVLQKLQNGLLKAEGHQNLLPIFSDLKDYDPVSNPRLASALTEPIKIIGSINASCQMQGKTGAKYSVTLSSCTCPDFQSRHIPCKHMYRLAIQHGLLQQFDDSLIRSKVISMLAQSAALKEEKKKYQKWLDSIEAFSKRTKYREHQLNERASQLEHIIHDSSISHPWASSQIADFYYALDMDVSRYLMAKTSPAYKASQTVSLYAKEKRSLTERVKSLEYQLKTYETVAPWLTDLSDSPPEQLFEITHSCFSDENANDEYASLRSWLSPEEYALLSRAEKYQLALERWTRSKKSNWQAGRDFERYVGYLYEQDGYRVEYCGALMGVNDLGRDLVAKNHSETLIIQCKRWIDKRTVHEKHIFQLYGSVVSYIIDHPYESVSGVLITTCPVSEKALQFAKYLSIKVDSTFRSDHIFDYPMIKCNIGNTGEKIYHLPFDQQYDRVVISPEKGEFYAKTVQEAEDCGFRRSFKWHQKNYITSLFI